MFADSGADESNGRSNQDPLPMEGSLLLAGLPLEHPIFHKHDWRDGQYFTAKDDPDRTREPWKPPQFVQELPLALAQRARVQRLRLPKGYSGRHSFATVVHNILDEQQCAALLECVNAKGFTPALLNRGGGNQVLARLSRDGHRVIVDSPQLANWFLASLRPYLPASVGRWELVDLNDRLRFLCYTPGQQFHAHVDSAYERPLGHGNAGAVSKVTVQVYLNDVPEENGGATTFFPDSGLDIPCQPVVGSVLLFTQDLEHEGSMLSAGIKYTLRTEAMYRRL